MIIEFDWVDWAAGPGGPDPLDCASDFSSRLLEAANCRLESWGTLSVHNNLEVCLNNCPPHPNMKWHTWRCLRAWKLLLSEWSVGITNEQKGLASSHAEKGMEPKARAAARKLLKRFINVILNVTVSCIWNHKEWHDRSGAGSESWGPLPGAAGATSKLSASERMPLIAGAPDVSLRTPKI